MAEKTLAELGLIEQLRLEKGASEFIREIVATVREPLVVLDIGLKVIFANKSFYHTFKVGPEETIGRVIYDLGNRQWNIPKLRQLLEDILPKNTTLENFKVEHNFETIGQKTMLLNARRIPRPPKKPVIVFSNLGNTSDIDRARDLGADDYLVKASLSPNQVVEKIRKHLR